MATHRHQVSCDDEDMKDRTAELAEGPEAFERFRRAVRTILSVPKSALPPSPFKKSKPKRQPAKKVR